MIERIQVLPYSVIMHTFTVQVHRTLYWINLIWILAVCFPLSANKTDISPEYLESLFKSGNYEKFSQLLNINVELVVPKKNGTSKNPMFNKNLDCGDILLTQHEKGRQGLNFETLPESKWGKYIPFTIINSNYTSAQKMKITQVIIQWNMEVQTVKWRPKLQRDTDYVVFFSGNGCYSSVGRRSGPQAVSLQADGCLSTGTIQHEMMHVTGFTHEHNRPDRDEYIRLLPENIDSDWLESYAKKSEKYYNSIGPYDYYSVMHYSVLDPDTNKPAFEILESGVDIHLVGQRTSMTAGDIEKVKKMYID